MLQSIFRSQVTRLVTNRIMPLCSRHFHDEFDNKNPDDVLKKLAPLKKFQVFQDSEQIILDVEEERQLREQQKLEKTLERPNPVAMDMEISMERGLNGVFEIEDLVKLLRSENAIDICVCKVPKELKYVDYLCVVTGRSQRHMLGMAEYIRRCFKLKRHHGDTLPKIEGATGRDWMAMDLGNIALHIFSPAARYNYDLESLWALGSQYDETCNRKQDDNLSHLDKYSIYLEDLKPKTDS